MITANYYVIASISILCLAANLLNLMELDLISKKAIKQFRFLAIFIIVEIVVDVLFKALEGNILIAPGVLYALKALEFSMNPVLVLLIFNLFYSSNNNNNAFKGIYYTLISITFVNIVFQIISLCRKFMFYIDEKNIYHRTGLTFVYVIFLVVSMILMIVAIYKFSLKVQNTNILTLSGFCIMLILGLSLRAFFPDVNYDWLCISIAYVLIDIYYVNLALRLDALTHLLNRQVYSTMIEKINFSTAIIMVDANNFKAINDTFGHECGDKTLQSLAKCINKTYGKYAYCFRIGGDEFCIILKKESFIQLVDMTPRSDVYLMVESLMKRLDEEIIARSQKDESSCLIYGVSQGYGIYYSPIEYPTILDNLPIDKVIKVADERMYVEKAKFRENLSKNLAMFETDKTPIIDRPKVYYESSNPAVIKEETK